MLDIRRMRVLREVAVHGSFSAAAEALNFTQSAVSQHVAALEREAGAKLIERRRGGGRLRLISFQSGGATLAPRAVAAFRARHPGVDLSLAEAEPEEACARLRSG